jgi:hypothetical protein
MRGARSAGDGISGSTTASLHVDGVGEPPEGVGISSSLPFEAVAGPPQLRQAEPRSLGVSRTSSSKVTAVRRLNEH